MPIYEYECEKCHTRVEFIQKFSDARKTRCPKCNGKLKRLISAPGLQFKGTGWYITDYARAGSGGSGSPDTNGGSSPASEDKKPAETQKPAAAEPARSKPRSSRRSAPARRRRR